MGKLRPKDIDRVELSREEAIKQFGEDIATQFDKYKNLCFKAEVKLRLRFSIKKERVEDTLFALVFPSKLLLKDKGKRLLNSYINKLLIAALEEKLSKPHPVYGKIISYEVIK